MDMAQMGGMLAGVDRKYFQRSSHGVEASRSDIMYTRPGAYILACMLAYGLPGPSTS